MSVKGVIVNLVFFLQVVILFLVVFDAYVEVPVIMTVLGRMHPLILHFPVVLILLFAVLIFLKLNQQIYDQLFEPVLLITVLFTSLTTLFGFILSTEEGYGGTLLERHKWTGVALSFLMFGAWYLRKSPKFIKVTTTLSVILILITGHLGASLTHGSGYLLGALEDDAIIINEEQPVYEAVIFPMLDRRCTSCHNPRKKKGNLDMSSVEAFLQGGESGPVINLSNPEESELYHRITLPIEDEDRMPPEGTRGFNGTETALIEAWLNEGADFSRKIKDLNQGDTLHQLVTSYISAQAESQSRYEFSSADPELVESLNNPYRRVRQNILNSPALEVRISVASAYQPEFLEELESVNEQITSLNLSYLPVNDDELKLINQFNNLERLFLNFTPVSDSGIEYLQDLENLKVLALSGTSVGQGVNDLLEQFPSLEMLYLWNTGLTSDEISELKESYSSIVIEGGYSPEEDEMLVISPPELANPSRILTGNEKIEFRHPVSDTRIYYTLDGTLPDTTATLYTEPFETDLLSQVKTVAFKPGWNISPISEFSFFRRGYIPSDMRLLKPADDKYPGRGPESFYDGKKGNIANFQSPEWLGYRENNLDVLLDMGEKPPEIGHVVLGYGLNVTSYIMKPVWVKLYGGDTPSEMRLIKTVEVTPSESYEPAREAAVDMETGTTSYRYYRLEAQPVKVLPSWHAGAGDRGWIFADEIFVY